MHNISSRAREWDAIRCQRGASVRCLNSREYAILIRRRKVLPSRSISYSTATHQHTEPSSVIDPHFGNWNHEAPTPLANVSELLHDFVFKIPGQDQNVIRLNFADALGWKDRNVTAREKFSLLIGIAINGERKQVGADGTVVQKRIAFARSAVTDN